MTIWRTSTARRSPSWPRPSRTRKGRVGAAEALRGLIDCITLTPDGEELRIELQGNLAAMLIMMVAGGGFEPPTFGL